MVGRLNRILQFARDVILLVFGMVAMSTSYGKWVVEPAHYVLFGISAALFALSVANIVLLIAKVKTRKYFYSNSIAQLVPSFILSGLLGVVGVTLLALNIAILVTLRAKKEKSAPQASLSKEGPQSASP